MAISGIQGAPATPQPQNPVQQLQQRKLPDHDGDAYDIRAEQKAALANGGPRRALDVKA